MTEEVEAWKARAKELEEDCNELQNALVKLCNRVTKIAVATGAVAIDKATLEFFPCKSDWSGSCKKCYFASGNYPYDTCRCENNQYHWTSGDMLLEACARDITKHGWIFMNGEAIVPTPDIYNKVAELLGCPKIEGGINND